MLSKITALQIGTGLVIASLGVLIVSLWLPTNLAWIARMGTVIMFFSGVQFHPKVATWLDTHKSQRVVMGTVMGVSLVWMLIEYTLS